MKTALLVAFALGLGTAHCSPSQDGTGPRGSMNDGSASPAGGPGADGVPAGPSQPSVPLVVPAVSTVIRVAAGATTPVSDDKGNAWAADKSFSGGTAVTQVPAVAIAGTATPALYNSERYDAATFGYDFPVPDAQYSVTLKFAEAYANAAGERIFNVAINGKAVLSAFDIYARAGGKNKAFDQAFPVTVTGGHIQLRFDKGSIQNPKVNAIEIISTSAPTAPTGDPSGQTSPSGKPPVSAPLASAAPGTFEEASLNGMTYALLKPHGYDGSKSYPIMLFLHQLQNDGAIPQQIQPWFNTAAFRKNHPAFIVAPRCPSSGESSNWGGVSAASQGCGDSAVLIV